MTLVPRLRGRAPLIMGVLNVTPDSFSDGGLFTHPEDAVAHALRMVEEGADILDIGGESTRPGSRRVDAEEQIRRTGGVIRALRAHVPAQIAISIDTTLPAVAREALNAGADLINDIHGGGEPGMLELAAERQAPIVIMHMQGSPETMQVNPTYKDVVAEVHEFLMLRAAQAEKLGLPRDHIVIDPGIGFGKTREHNLALIQSLSHFAASGYPVLLGTSRKRFMGSICNETDPRALIGATCATTALGVVAGVRIFRVHDVKPNRQAADVAHALRGGG
ncbi:MAG: Dihydropteroate synthase [Gammaproteobacteria bacterium]|nr:Dihydropteroate synthase [Gammaproteobacteria bacterium]